MKNTQHHNEKKIKIMEACYNCYAEYGLTGASVAKLSKAAGIAQGLIYLYFENLDDLIIQSTEYCMSKVEDEFMAKAPTDPHDLLRFFTEIPYWTAREHGKKYRLMYQIYTNPKYIEHGKKFFQGVNERYTKYAQTLESKLGISYTIITPLIFIFVRACVHFALFEDEFYLKTQLKVLEEGIKIFMKSANEKDETK